MTEIIGYLAAFLTTASFLPQVFKALKTGDTSGISLIMYLMLIGGVILWLIYGILLQNKIIILSNSITTILAVIVLLIKVRNSFKA